MKRLITIILSLLTLAAMGGCSDKSKDESVQTTQTSALTTNEPQTSASTSNGKFDWDTAMNETYLDGVKIKMPFSLNDLGDGYKMGTVKDEVFDNIGCYTSVYKITGYDEELDKSEDEKIAFVSFDNISAAEYTDDTPVTYIADMDGLCIQGIEKGVSMELVYSTWGEPKENDKIAIYYGEDTTKKIHIYKTDDDCVSQISINFNETS